MTDKQPNKATAKERGKLDPPVFSTLIHSISHSALMAMGMTPETQEKKDRALAEFNIELLLLLREKTKGNLTTEEEQLMDTCIQDLQITFAQNK